MVPGWMVGWLSVSVSMAPATTLMAKTMFQPVVIPFSRYNESNDELMIKDGVSDLTGYVVSF